MSPSGWPMTLPGPGRGGAGLVAHKAGVKRSEWPGNPEGLHPRPPSGNSPRFPDSRRGNRLGEGVTSP